MFLAKTDIQYGHTDLSCYFTCSICTECAFHIDFISESCGICLLQLFAAIESFACLLTTPDPPVHGARDEAREMRLRK